MAKEATKPVKTLRVYTLPEYGVVVEAENVEQAISAAKKLVKEKNNG